MSSMHIKRTLLLGIGGGAVAVWIAAASTSSSRPSPAVAVQPATDDNSGAALAAEVSHLHERLHPATEPLQSRDLFRYESRRRSAVAQVAAVAAPVVPLVVPPAGPPLRLVGIAEDVSPDGTVRTAIVSDVGELLFIKAGDVVAGKYRVEQVGSDAVELVDSSDNSTIRLALK